MRRALGRLADEPTYLQHALGPGVAARERRSVRHGPAVDRFVEVLGREIEVAGAKLLNHPLDLVHARPPARRPPASAVHDPLCPVRLIGIAQPAKVPLAHPQQLRRPRYQTWPTGCCGLESGDAKAIPVRKLILSRSPAPPPWSRGGACHDATEALPPGAGHCPGPSPCGRR